MSVYKSDGKFNLRFMGYLNFFFCDSIYRHAVAATLFSLPLRSRRKTQ